MNEIIDLNGCYINGSEEEINEIIRMVKSKSSFVELNLGNNALGDEGAKMLGQYLKEDKKIISLNIANNFISPDGMRYISDGLKQNSIIENIDISSNVIFDESGKDFIESLDKMKSIKNIKMNGTLIGNFTVKALSDYIKNHLTLELVQIKSNGILAENYSILLEAQRINRNCKINVKYNVFNETQERSFSRKENTIGFFPTQHVSSSIEDKNNMEMQELLAIKAYLSENERILEFIKANPNLLHKVADSFAKVDSLECN